MARRESLADLGVERFELGVHAVATEPFAQVDQRGGIRGFEARIEDDDGRDHDVNANPRGSPSLRERRSSLADRER